MAWKTHKESIPLIRPLYYLYPNDEKAYKFSDQYFFGSELLCSPFISKIIPEIGRSRQELWLPEGIWFNFFTGEYFEGGDIYAIYGKLDEIPVFAKAGAIIPLAHQSKKNLQWNKTSNPEYLDIVIFPGANNKFQLYEDDGETQDYLDGKYIITEFLLNDQKQALYFKINNISNGISLNIIPKERKYKIIFNGIKKPDEIKIQINEKIVEFQSKFFPNKDKLEIKAIKLGPTDRLDVYLSKKTGKLISKRDRTVENVQNLLRFMEINSELKKYLDYRINEIISDVKKFKKILSNLAKGIITELTNPTEVEIFKKTLSNINAGNILESILLNNSKPLLKDQLYNINLNDKTSTRKVFLDVIRKSSTLNLLFSLKESQIKALIEICVAPIIFESFVMV
jgi:hypothetical protein